MAEDLITIRVAKKGATERLQIVIACVQTGLLLLGEVYPFLEPIIAWGVLGIQDFVSEVCLLDVVIPPFGDGIELE